MELLNADIISRILSKDDSIIPEIHILNWDVENNIIDIGNNYGSEITRLKISYERNGKPHSKKYIYKLPFKTPLYEIGAKLGTFQKEIDMYTLVLPEICRNDIAPSCYHIGDKHTLVLEDLSQSGYILAKKTDQLDFEQCRMALINLAKFHAFSVHLDKLNKIPDSLKDGGFFKRFMDEGKFGYFLRNSWTQFLDQLEEPFKSRYSTKLKKMLDTVPEDYVNLLLPMKNRFNCLGHGDFHLGNLLFKYDEYGIVERIKFIDFQCCSWTSPVVDILKFAAGSMRFEVYERYFDLLLDIYLETLNRVLVHFNCDIYEKVDFKKDIEDRFLLTVIAVITMLPVALAEYKQDDVKDLDMGKNFTDDEGSKKFLETVGRNSRIMEVLMKWFKFFVDRGLLDD